MFVYFNLLELNLLRVLSELYVHMCTLRLRAFKRQPMPLCENVNNQQCVCVCFFSRHCIVINRVALCVHIRLCTTVVLCSSSLINVEIVLICDDAGGEEKGCFKL